MVTSAADVKSFLNYRNYRKSGVNCFWAPEYTTVCFQDAVWLVAWAPLSGVAEPVPYAVFQ